MIEFIDTCEFCFSSLVSADPQKCSLLWYTLKHRVAHNLMLHSHHLNFVVVSLFLTEHTWHRILSHCISRCVLCLVSCLFRWLVEGTCFPALVVKTLSAEGFLMIWGSSFVITQWDACKPVDYKYSRSTVCQSTVWHLCLWHHLCHCQYHCYSSSMSESSSNTSSVMSPSVMFSLCTAKCTLKTQQTQHFLTVFVIQVSAVPGLSHVAALRAEKTDLVMILQFKKVLKKSLQQNDKQLPLVPYCSKHRNKCLYSQFYSPTDGIWTNLPQHTDKPAPTQKLNIIIGLEL